MVFHPYLVEKTEHRSLSLDTAGGGYGGQIASYSDEPAALEKGSSVCKSRAGHRKEETYSHEKDLPEAQYHHTRLASICHEVRL